MKTNLILAGALALSVAGTGCATKKYVAKTMAPIESRVTGTEGKNADQDKQLTAQAQEIDEVRTHVSRNDEKIADADAKAQRGIDSAAAAQKTALEASDQANNAMTTATNGRDQAIAQVNEVARKMDSKLDSSLRMRMADSETVLFATNKYNLTPEAKATLDEFASKLHGKDRYVVEIQGFTDKTGSADGNATLSQKRAEAVSRYLVNEHQVPLHMVNMLGSGYAQAIGDDATRDGRKQNRRVEVRLFTPETASLSASAAGASGGR
jgi:outer membrane protein OmpA-like peptidoglycan-associated protein